MSVAIRRLAQRMIRSLQDATQNEPNQWRAITTLTDDSRGVEAAQYAVDEGWLVADGIRSVCATAKGRALFARPRSRRIA